jgi:signal transduction histidine kinase
VSTTSHLDRSSDARRCDSAPFLAADAAPRSCPADSAVAPHLTLLLAVGQLLERVCSREGLSEQVADLLVEEYADLAALLLFTWEGQVAHCGVRQQSLGPGALAASLAQVDALLPLCVALSQSCPNISTRLVPVSPIPAVTPNGHAEDLAVVFPPLAGSSTVVAPLVSRDRTVGALVVARDALTPPFTPDDQPIVEALTGQVAPSVENARLYREVADRERALRRLVHKLMSAQEEERQRVAHELHDEVAQKASGLRHYLEAFALARPGRPAAERTKLETAIDLARRLGDATRQVLAGLRPTPVNDLGLRRALGAYAESLAAFGLTVGYSASLPCAALTPDAEIALFRVAQEGLANVRKHAGTGRANLSIKATQTQVTLEVRDSGRGFDPLRVEGDDPAGHRLGLLGMRERLALIGGSLTVISSPGMGTCVRAVVPLTCTCPDRANRRGARR